MEASAAFAHSLSMERHHGSLPGISGLRVVRFQRLCRRRPQRWLAELAGMKPLFNGKDLTGWDGDPGSGPSKTASFVEKRLPRTRPEATRSSSARASW